MGLITGLLASALVMGGFAFLLYLWTNKIHRGEDIHEASNRILFDDDPHDDAIPGAVDRPDDDPTPAAIATSDPITARSLPPAGASETTTRPSLDAPDNLFGHARAELGAFLRLPALGTRGIVLIAGLVFVAWISAGFYVVQPDEQGVVLQFGRWVDTQDPGLHYHLPYPIETVLLPKITQVNQLQIGAPEDVTGNGPSRQMLTGDENIVEAEFSVFWKIKDVRAYLFRNADQDGMLKTTAESVLHAIIARYPIQDALSDKRQQIADQAQTALQDLLDSYNAGILITEVQLQRVDPPAEVLDAFNDVQRALADKERARNEAEAYSNDILPRARGQAQHIIAQADAYKAQVVDLAQGDLSSYLSAYKVYKQAPDVVSWRLYLDSMDAVLARASRVIIDSSGKGVAPILPYLPMTDQKPAPSAGGNVP